MPHAEFVLSGDLILADRILPAGAVLVREGRIADLGPRAEILAELPPGVERSAFDGYISPGFVDLHVHGGRGADFMDGNEDAFATALCAHARHGTTSLLPTSTAARHEQILALLELCRRFKNRRDARGARVLGAISTGPISPPKREAAIRPRRCVAEPREYEQYLQFADAIATASIAPELPGAEPFARACGERGIRLNAGHTHATFLQMAAAIDWGVRHVDHLYCAMSDKAKLRQQQPYPMRGGVLEATLYFDELTTEVIADGKHLSADLLLLAWKIKGPDRLALVTDCNRALDMPEGSYIFGPEDGWRAVHQPRRRRHNARRPSAGLERARHGSHGAHLCEADGPAAVGSGADGQR